MAVNDIIPTKPISFPIISTGPTPLNTPIQNAIARFEAESRVHHVRARRQALDFGRAAAHKNSPAYHVLLEKETESRWESAYELIRNCGRTNGRDIHADGSRPFLFVKDAHPEIVPDGKPRVELREGSLRKMQRVLEGRVERRGRKKKGYYDTTPSPTEKENAGSTHDQDNKYVAKLEKRGRPKGAKNKKVMVETTGFYNKMQKEGDIVKRMYHEYRCGYVDITSYIMGSNGS